MKPLFTFLLFYLFTFSTFSSLSAQDFSQHFADSTLRLDYIFAGDTQRQDIYLDELSMSPRPTSRADRSSTATPSPPSSRNGYRRQRPSR